MHTLNNNNEAMRFASGDPFLKEEETATDRKGDYSGKKRYSVTQGEGGGRGKWRYVTPATPAESLMQNIMGRLRRRLELLSDDNM